ncbi:methylitaconate delta2-delta3-isomerase [Hyaloraphidium curvatum]|nr:methylitaconate delta2-delta3-isomerase [Hyaloraphidium curvatum]
MRQMLAVPAALIRGGTSKGLFFGSADLHAAFGADLARRDAFISRALGSPDASGMQMDGVGGAISSSSKVCIIGKSAREGFDLDWEFGQVGIKDGKIDWKGSCGNLASATLLHARDVLQIVPPSMLRARVWQIGAGKELLVEEKPDELVEISGVPGRKEPAVDVTFLGSGDGDGEGPQVPLLPTGNVVDVLANCAGSPRTTLIGQPNPTIIVAESSRPVDVDIDAWLASLREHGAHLMGIPLSPAVRAALLREPDSYSTSSGDPISPGQADLYARITTPGRRYHHAMTGTGSSALALAAGIPGTVAHAFAARAGGPKRAGRTVIAHPGGLIEARAQAVEVEGRWRAVSVGFVRSARALFKGEVFA